MEDINTFERLKHKAVMLRTFERYALHYNRAKDTAIIQRNIKALTHEAMEAVIFNKTLTHEQFGSILIAITQ